MSLLKKTWYTMLANIVTTVLNFGSNLILIPLEVKAFGDDLFGLYTIINKASSFMSVIDLRPTACLRYIVAQKQSDSEEDHETQEKYISATVLVSILTMPVFLLAGVIIGFVFPYIYKVDPLLVNTVRICVVIVSVQLIFRSFAGIPQATIRGNNLEYLLWWVNAFQTISNVLLIIFLLKKGFGIVMVICVPLIIVFITGICEYIIMRRRLSWIRWRKPDRGNIKNLFGYGVWYLLYSMSYQLYQNMDILLVGYFFDMNTVTVYTVSKNLLFRSEESVANIMNAPTASIGTLIGQNDIPSAYKGRSHIFEACFFIGIVMSVGFILFNKSFVALWMGESYYIGKWLNVILVLAAFFSMLTTSENILINSSLKFKNRFYCFVKAITIQVIITLISWKMCGQISILLGLISGRLFYFANSFRECNKILKCTTRGFVLEHKGIILIGMAFIVVACILNIPMLKNWFLFVLWAAVCGIIVSMVCFAGLQNETKQYLKHYISLHILKKGEKA